MVAVSNRNNRSARSGSFHFGFLVLAAGVMVSCSSIAAELDCKPLEFTGIGGGGGLARMRYLQALSVSPMEWRRLRWTRNGLHRQDGQDRDSSAIHLEESDASRAPIHGRSGGRLRGGGYTTCSG